MSFSTDKPIIQRSDGTFVIQHWSEDRFLPYHVCGLEVDPYNLYDLVEVGEFAIAHPELVGIEGA